MTCTSPNAADYLKYASARLNSCTEWVTDSIAGSTCDHLTGHEDELNAVNDTVTEIHQLAALFGDPRTYSDGRRVQTSAQIDDGLVTSHVWHPDVTAEEPRSWRGQLLSDPGTPSPGRYEITLEPATQGIHVRVIRTA